MPTIRQYQNPQPVETINSLPIEFPLPAVFIAIAPNAEVVSTSTMYGSYTYSAAPAMYYHDAQQPLVFTGSIQAYSPFNVIEWFWDFGDGTNDVGNPVSHTYAYGNADTIIHLRVTDDTGRQAWGSLNPMLRPTGDAFVVGDGVIYV